MNDPDVMLDERIEFIRPNHKTRARQRLMQAALKTGVIVLFSCVATLTVLRAMDSNAIHTFM